MTKPELISAIENGNDIMLKVEDRGFTILAWRDGGPDIGEWDKPDTVQQFPDAQALVDGYKLGDKTLGELAEKVVITEYT